MKFLRLWATIFGLALGVLLGGVLIIVPGVLMVRLLPPELAPVCGLIYIIGVISALYVVIEYDNWE